MIRTGTFWERIGDWFFATVTDPGNLRLHSAIKSFLAIVLSVLVVVALALVLKLSLLVALLSVMVAPQGTMLRGKKGKPADLWISALVLMIAGAFTAVMGDLLAFDHVLSMAGFVAVMTVATYVRRFGMRGILTGSTIFGAYINFLAFALLSPKLLPPISQTPWIVFCVVVCILCGMLVTFVLRDRPERNVHNLLSTLNNRIEDVIAVLSEALHQNTVDRRLLRKLRTRFIWLDDTEIMIQRQLDLLNSKVLPDRINYEKFKCDLFDIEIAAEELVRAGIGMASTYDDMTPLSRVMLLGALETLRSALRKDHPIASLQSTAHAAIKLASEDLIDTLDAHRLAIAIEHLASALLRLRTQAEVSEVSMSVSDPDWMAAPLSNSQPAMAASASVRHERPPFWERMSPTTKQALQVLIATALAALIGNVLSTQRVYWAVMAAFMAISGSNSRIESLNKGFSSAFGTLLGVIVGTIVASLVAGNLVISIILIIVCIFMMMYWASANQSIMTMVVTTMLALLFGLLGEFSIQLLTLRLEETALGVLIGSLAALFILPVYTGRAVRADMQQFLTDLEKMVSNAISHLMYEPVPAASLIVQAQGLKPQLQTLRQHALPLTRGLLASGSHNIQSSILVFMYCEHHVRILVRAVNQIDMMSLNPALLTTLSQLAGQMSANIQTLKATLADHRPASIDSIEHQLETFEVTVLHSAEHPDQNLLRAVHALRQIDQAVVLLTRDHLGVPRAATDPLNKLIHA